MLGTGARTARQVLADAWAAGVVLCGLSAGSLCWFAEAVTAFHGPPQRGAGPRSAAWSNCVHYDGEPSRRREYLRFVGDGMGPGYAADDGARAALRGRRAARGRVLAAGQGRAPRAVRTARSVEQRHRRARTSARRRRAGRGDDGPDRSSPSGAAASRWRRTPRRWTTSSSRSRGAREPRILFLPTAGGDPREQIGRFHATFGDRAVPSRRSCRSFRRPRHALAARHRLSHDIVYVGGGSMRNLLAIWRVHRLDAILREAWERGSCWRAERRRDVLVPGRRDDVQRLPEPTAGLGLLPGSLSVHADSEPAAGRPAPRDPRRRCCRPGTSADDGAGLLFRGTRLERAVSSRPAARLPRRGDRRRDRRDADPPYLPGQRGAPRAVPFDVPVRQTRPGPWPPPRTCRHAPQE
jgi:peptidase E